jgi:hypothetical protein
MPAELSRAALTDDRPDAITARLTRAIAHARPDAIADA